ncbi:MAG: hypothetical protein QE271_09195 [Bacteriovoracaceae bacterium]|nr:hypothetical protein [Bacteriovoracaceae bacterium]
MKNTILQFFFYFSITLIFSSCSLVENTRRSLLGAPAKSDKRSSKLSASSALGETVPREQYETLLSQYNSLKQKYEPVAPTSELNPDSPTVELQGAVAPGDELAKMVPLADAPDLGNNNESSDFGELRKGMLAYEIQKYDLAMNIFDKLTNSREDQVKYRSRFYAAKILLAKNEYNLALQVFEDLIERYAFSGLTAESLQGAKECAEKLGKPDKVKKFQELSKRLGMEAT